jgi:hypothetical protein
VSRPALVPWSEQMSAHHMKPRPIDYRCWCVIHNFSSSKGKMSVLFGLSRHRGAISYFSSMQQVVEGWYDPADLLPPLVEDEKFGGVYGGSID